MKKMTPIEKIRTALQFLTIFDLGNNKNDYDLEDIAGSIIFFPLAGLILGLICAVVYYAVVYISGNHLIASLFPVFLLAILSRGLHLDGIADTFDAIHFAKYDKKKALEVMKDNSVGAFGATALILLLITKFIFIYSIPYESIFPVIVLIPAVSRWTSSLVAKYTTPASEKGLGYTFTEYVTTENFVVCSIVTFVISIICLGLAGVLIFFSVVIFSALLTWYFNNTFGGTTGDIYGSVIEISELFGLLAAILILK